MVLALDPVSRLLDHCCTHHKASYLDLNLKGCLASNSNMGPLIPKIKNQAHSKIQKKMSQGGSGRTSFTDSIPDINTT